MSVLSYALLSLPNLTSLRRWSSLGMPQVSTDIDGNGVRKFEILADCFNRPSNHREKLSGRYKLNAKVPT
jgi:hypothetical protein